MSVLLNVHISFESNTESKEAHQPFITDASKGAISGDVNISRFFIRSQNRAVELLAANDQWAAAQVDSWLELYTNGNPAVLPALVNTHMANRTYLVGCATSLADIAIHLTIVKTAGIDLAGMPLTL